MMGHKDYQGFLKILEMYLVSLGIHQAKQVLLIADGAEWIWKHIPPLLEKLNCPLETYELLDFYHALNICKYSQIIFFIQKQNEKNGLNKLVLH